MWHKNIPVKTVQIPCLQAWEYVQVAHGSSRFLKSNAVKILIFCNKTLPHPNKMQFCVFTRTVQGNAWELKGDEYTGYTGTPGMLDWQGSPEQKAALPLAVTENLSSLNKGTHMHRT